MLATKRIRAGAALATFFIAILVILGTHPAFAAIDGSIFENGSGSQSDPYTISNALQLEAFRDSVNEGNTYEGKYVKLANDIDIGGQQWIPIGSAKRQGMSIVAGSNSFAGTFDGSGHTVSNLTITPNGTQTDSPDYTIGFFGAVVGGTIENLTLENVEIKDSSSELAGSAVGLLIEGGTVTNVNVSGSISGKAAIGGIVGRMIANGTISNCTNEATVIGLNGTGNVGGIVGAAYYSPAGSYMSIDSCINKGSVSGTNDVGGIAGLCCAFVSGCKNSGTVTGSSFSVGGIAGEIKNHGGVTKCMNSANVVNTSKSKPYGTGGIVGWVRYDGAAPAYALSEKIDIVDNTNSGSVKTESAIGAGGIIGILYSSGTVTKNENSAPSISGSQFIGGIVGGIQDQGSSTLPPGIENDAEVTNNVSTTPLSDMTGSLKNEYAYNNNASVFIVKDNGSAWVATDDSVGDMSYATLGLAISKAPDMATIKLIADTENNGLLETSQSRDITIDLNGHDIGFSSTGAINAKGSTVTICGEGNLYAKDNSGAFIESPVILKTESISGGKDGTFLLKGGTYPTDISEYVAKGYRVAELTEPNAFDNKFEVEAIPEDANPNDSKNPKTPASPTKPTKPTTPSNKNNKTSSKNGNVSNGNNASNHANKGKSATISNTLASSKQTTSVGRLNKTSDDFADVSILFVTICTLGFAISASYALIYARHSKSSDD